MATVSILAVPGLASTTPEFRCALAQMAERNGWDVDAIATVISSESGFRADVKNPLPGQSASGLIQMIDSTARAVGVPGGAAGLRELSAEEQIPYIERFYQMSFGARRDLRPVDYYLAGWGSGIGKPSTHVLAERDAPKTLSGGEHNLYTLNAGLDVDKDGTITVGDLANKISRIQAGRARLETECRTPAPLPPLGEPEDPKGQWPGPSYLSPLPGGYSYAPWPVLRKGSAGPFVRVWQRIVGVKDDGLFGPRTLAATKAWHDARGVSFFSSAVYSRSWGAVSPEEWERVFSCPG